MTQLVTRDERKQALEKYGDGNTGNEWQYMAEYVGQRTPNEIKLHAHKYFIKLQAATQRRTHHTMPSAAGSSQPIMSGALVATLDDQSWTKREEASAPQCACPHAKGMPYTATARS